MSQAQDIVNGLGGADNISEVESCITRLRIVVIDERSVNEEKLTQAGAVGVVQTGHDIQIAVGPDADNIAQDVQALL